MKPGILIVSESNDSRARLRALLQSSFELLEFADYTQATHALDVLEPTTPHPIILVDEDIEFHESVEFLAHANKIYPDSKRIFATEAGDAKALIKAINRGRIYRLMLKPFTDEELLKVVGQALDAFHLQRERDSQLRELHQRHTQLEEIMLARLGSLQDVLQDLQLPAVHDYESFARDAGSQLPDMLQQSQELLSQLEEWDKNKIISLAHTLHTSALSLNASFDSMLREVRKKTRAAQAEEGEDS